jgi:hypothetical protein
MVLFLYLVLFGSVNINGFCKPFTEILTVSEKNAVYDGGLSPFQSQYAKVKKP